MARKTIPAPITRGITNKLADRLQQMLNDHTDASDAVRARPVETQFTAAEMRALIAALRFVLLAPGYTR